MMQTEHLARHARRGLIASLKYVFDILGGAIHLLRKPLSVVVFLYILAFLLRGLWPTLWVAFNPLCRVPGISRLEICRPPTVTPPFRGPPSRNGPNYPKLVDVQSRTFEKLLHDSSDYTGLSTEIKRAEMATTDLITLVRGSRLVSKEMLAEVLDEFVSDAKKTGRSLQKLHAKVGGAVDDILAVNDWALKTIEKAEASALSGFSGAIKALIPGAPTQASIRSTITRTFTDSMSTVSSNLKRLIIEAELSLGHLNDLEEKLNTLYDILRREDIVQKEERDEILRLLWTKLGGNKKKLKGVDDHLTLLKDLGIYRRKARAHVVGALQTLGEMSEGIEDLRERAAQPALLASDDENDTGRGEIPVQVHVQSIKMGLERLRDGRKRAKLIEQAVVRKVLSANDLDDPRELGSGSDFLGVMD
ncbi:hypothetical protein BDN72DRAFT_760401 [Pluteus cervinus]|uniref:Uncharacterized protein n=1 Tax=Pluteus cervinus TaxID=181527 RepID=A0ACD3B880_9AGAR|nr:hypothetical protein BDN72DRAFT_760401 [Pluteus cervinus]